MAKKNDTTTPFTPSFNQQENLDTPVTGPSPIIDPDIISEELWRKMTDETLDLNSDVKPYLDSDHGILSGKFAWKGLRTSQFIIQENKIDKLIVKHNSDGTVSYNPVAKANEPLDIGLMIATLRRNALLKLKAKVGKSDEEAIKNNPSFFRVNIDQCGAAKDIVIILKFMQSGSPKLSAFLTEAAKDQVEKAMKNNANAESKDKLSAKDIEILQQQLAEQAGMGLEAGSTSGSSKLR